MLLENKVAVLRGIRQRGPTIARAFSRGGPTLFSPVARFRQWRRWPGRSRRREVAREAAQVDATDEGAIDNTWTRSWRRSAGWTSFNESGIAQPGIQGIPLLDLPVESFMLPVGHYLRSNFLTAPAAARR